MSRGRTFQQVVEATKAEARHSLSPALGVNALPYIEQTVKRCYETLYAQDWPHLSIKRLMSTQAGMRYYAFPSDMSFERTSELYVKYAGQWSDKPLAYGIGTAEYNSVDSDADVRQDPAKKWDLREGDMFELWPMPASNGTNDLRLHGQKKFVPLVLQSDICLLDDNLVALFAAGEILAAQKSADAQAKITQANALLVQLKGKLSKNRVISWLGPGDAPAEREVRVTYARAE